MMDSESRMEEAVYAGGCFCPAGGVIGPWPGGSLDRAATKRMEATKPLLQYALTRAKSKKGISDAHVKRVVRQGLNRQRIDSADWIYYQVWAQRVTGVRLWQDAWFTKESLAARFAELGIQVLDGEVGSWTLIVAPYPQMTEEEAARFMKWAWGRRDKSLGDDWGASTDPKLLEQARQLGEVMSGSALNRVLYEVSNARWDEWTQYVEPSASGWDAALTLRSAWSGTPGFDPNIPDM